MTAPALIEARDVRKAFGPVEVLHGVSTQVASGEVLALLGENGAGKSTLVRVLAGDHSPSSGDVLVDGKTVTGALSPRLMRRYGLALIPQETSSVETLTVAENVALGAWPVKHGFIAWRSIRSQARRILDDLGMDIDIDCPVSELGVGERQIIDIARALVANARCLILDEPTAALSQAETTELFRLVRNVRDRGAGVIYITHRLHEVTIIADRIQVLRDGRTVLEGRTADLDQDTIVTHMVGSSVKMADLHQGRAPVQRDARPAVALRGASSRPAFRDLDLEVFPREIAVIYGKVGSGAAEVAGALFGMRKMDAGTLEIKGEPVTLRSPNDAIGHGIGFLPGDRKTTGFLDLSIAGNLCAPSWKTLSRRGFVHTGSEREVYSKWRSTLSVRGESGPDQPLSTLSGGNQQKVLLGRWLEMRSEVLIMVEPTRGVDIKARQDIYRLLATVADNGGAVLVVTSDQEEAAIIADRVVVMSAGRQVARLEGAEINEDRLLEAAIRGERTESVPC